MKYIVYLTICTANNKIYVGVHKTENPDIFDGYIGNGVRVNVPASYKRSKTPFQFAVNKYGVKKFRRTIIQIFDNENDAYALERSIVTEQFIKRADTYNVKLGGEGSCPEILKTKVYMYDINGEFVREFDTTADCNRYFDKNAKSGGHVPRAIRLGHLFHGYQLSYEKLPYMKKFKPKVPWNKGKKVAQYTLDGELVKIWDCVSHVLKGGFCGARRNLSGKSKSCKGYIFKFIEN